MFYSVGARRSENIVYAFKYVNIIGDESDFLHTPVREMPKSYWCKYGNRPQVNAALVVCGKVTIIQQTGLRALLQI